MDTPAPARPARAPLAAPALAVAALLALGGCVVAPVAPAGRPLPPPPLAVLPGPVIELPPPAPYAEVIPMAPGPAYVWIGGHWSWYLGRHVWIGGRWALPPPGHGWVPGYWGRHGPGWRWHGGYWRRR
jgi:hypothetical protein